MMQRLTGSTKAKLKDQILSFLQMKQGQDLHLPSSKRKATDKKIFSSSSS